MPKTDLTFTAESANVSANYHDRGKIEVCAQGVELAYLLRNVTIAQILAEHDQDDFLEEIGVERAKIYWDLEDSE